MPKSVLLGTLAFALATLSLWNVNTAVSLAAGETDQPQHIALVKHNWRATHRNWSSLRLPAK